MAVAWLRRLFERLGAARPPAGGGSAQAERVDRVWQGRGALGSAAALFEALRRAIGDGPVEADALRRLADHLRGGFGSEYAARGGHVEEHIEFWRALAGRDGGAAARGFLADCLLAAGRREEAMAEFDRAFTAEPALVLEFGDELYEVAREVGGPAWVGYRLACLRVALAALGDPRARDDEDADQIREMYGELCEDHRGDPTAEARVREVGREIEAAVERGALPRALVRRTARRRPQAT
jgi:tetratricopeptide (TPR) repeat protein